MMKLKTLLVFSFLYDVKCLADQSEVRSRNQFQESSFTNSNDRLIIKCLVKGFAE